MQNYNGSSSSYPTSVRCIQDGDAPSEANLAAASRDLADRTAYLKTRGVVDENIVTVANIGFVVGTVSTTSWVDVSGASLSFTNMSVGDVIHVDFASVANWNGSDPGKYHDLKVIAVDAYGGTPVVADVEGATYRDNADPGDPQTTISMVGRHVVASAGTTVLQLQGRVETSGDNMRLLNSMTLRALVRRSA